MGIEWSGHQQLLFFVQSIGVGLIIGVLFDVFTGWERVKRSMLKTFLVDVLFCLFASFVTFFAALVIMNGQLHPLLLFGIGLGAVIVHVTVGHGISAAVALIGHFFTKMNSIFTELEGALLNLFLRVKEKRMKKCKKKSKKSEKNKVSR